MPDKDKATRLLGFRDEHGELICPADILDSSKSYVCHVGAEDGSFTPTKEDLKKIRKLFSEIGLDVKPLQREIDGGRIFRNKKGIVICRIVESSATSDPSQRKLWEKEDDPDLINILRDKSEKNPKLKYLDPKPPVSSPTPEKKTAEVKAKEEVAVDSVPSSEKKTSKASSKKKTSKKKASKKSASKKSSKKKIVVVVKNRKKADETDGA